MGPKSSLNEPTYDLRVRPESLCGKETCRHRDRTDLRTVNGIASMQLFPGKFSRKPIRFLLLSLLLLPIAGQSHRPRLMASPTKMDGPGKMARSHKSGFQVFMKQFDQNVKRVILPNGLRLIMVRRNFSPTVSCYIKFRAGSADETSSNSGIAHMLEHMLFKGTRKVGVRHYAKEEKYVKTINSLSMNKDALRHKLEALNRRNISPTGQKVKSKRKNKHAYRLRRKIKILGRRIRMLKELSATFIRPDEDSRLYSLHGQKGFNAYTNRDLTNYQIRLPNNRLEVWARIESDRMANAVMRGFYTERKVIMEERRMRTENIARNLLIERFMQAVYADHPYAKPVIGPMRSISYLNHVQAKKYYREYYAPNNTVIALVGDLDFLATEKLIRKYFGPLASRSLPRKRIKKPRVTTAPIRISLKRKSSPVQFLAWFKPPFPQKDNPALLVLAEILAGGPDSRLHRKLVLQKKIAVSVAAYTDYPGERYRNLFLIQAEPAPGRSYDEIEKEILKEIKLLSSEGPLKEEMQRALMKLQSDFVFSLRSNANLADNLSYYELLVGNYADIFRFYDDLSNVNKKSIRLVTKKYLIPQAVMTARIVPPEKTASRQRP